MVQQSRLDVVRGVGYHDDLMIKDFRLERDITGIITIVISVKKIPNSH